MTDPNAPGRMLGVDYGARRIGIAVSEGRVAVPLTIIEHTDRAGDLDRIAKLVIEHGAGTIVVGLPLLMSGDEGEQARRTRRFGDALGRRASLPVIYHDERLSSFSAEDATRAAPARRRGAAPRIDDIAASVILQSYLDECEDAGAHRAESNP